MDCVIRAVAIYFFLLLIFRLAGSRSLARITTFDFVLLLVIGEVTQQALTGQDYSVTNALVLIITLVGLDIALSVIKERSPRFEKFVDGVPIVLIRNGRLLEEPMKHERVGEEDILEFARELRGLARLDQIKYAVLERDGAITIVPKDNERRPHDGDQPKG